MKEFELILMELNFGLIFLSCYSELHFEIRVVSCIHVRKIPRSFAFQNLHIACICKTGDNSGTRAFI